MGLYPDDLPWLSKPAALRRVWQAVAAALGAGARPRRLPRHGAGRRLVRRRAARAASTQIDERARRRAAFDAAAAGLERRVRPAGREPPLAAGRHVRLRLLRLPRRRPRPRPGCARSATAGTSCPWSSRIRSGSRASRAVDGLVVPFADPATGRRCAACGSRAGRPRACGRRTRPGSPRCSASSRSLGLDYVVVGDSDPAVVVRGVLRLGRGAHRVPAGRVAVRRSWAVGRGRAAAGRRCLLVVLALGWSAGRPRGRARRRPFSATAVALDRAPSRSATRSARGSTCWSTRRRSTPVSVRGARRASAPTASPAPRSRTDATATASSLSYRYALECLMPGCAPQRAGVAAAVPARASSRYRTRDGGQRVTSRSAGPRTSCSRGLDGRTTAARRRTTCASTRALPAPDVPDRAGHAAGARSPRSPPCSRSPPARSPGSRCAGARRRAGRSRLAARAGAAGGAREHRQRPAGRARGRRSAGSAASSRAVERPDRGDAARRLAWSAEPRRPPAVGRRLRRPRSRARRTRSDGAPVDPALLRRRALVARGAPGRSFVADRRSRPLLVGGARRCVPAHARTHSQDDALLAAGRSPVSPSTSPGASRTPTSS